MIFTDAPIELRYARMRGRRRDGEAEITLEAFKQREADEATTGTNDADFNREAIRELADLFVTNEGSLEEFHGKIETLLNTINSAGKTHEQ